MTELVLHVGQSKAASTSIQSALFENRKALADAGICYPATTKNQHGPQVADLFLRFADVSTFPGFLLANHEAGGWDRLCQEVRDAQRAIVSAETLSLCSHELAGKVVRDLSADGSASIVVGVRRPSAAVVSNYTQVARVQPTLSCETWVRASLRRALSNSDRSLVNLHNPLLVRIWQEWGPVTLVHVDDRAPGDLDRDVLAAFGLTGLLQTPFLQRRNASPSAARLVAWQQLQSRRPDRAVLKRATEPDELSATLPAAGGRFRLNDDVAALVDLTFPTAPDTPIDRQARESLVRRLTDPVPMTCVGMDDQYFAEAVAICRADLEARMR